MYYVYILSNLTRTTIYIGVTNNLVRRIWEHKTNADPTGFSARYHTSLLVHYEVFSTAYEAISREKQLKSWNRKRKNTLIASENPTWRDLYPDIVE